LVSFALFRVSGVLLCYAWQGMGDENFGGWTRVEVSREELLNAKSLPGLTPAHDEHWIELGGRALAGEEPVYFAMVPIGNLIPFDIDYRPDLHPLGRADIARCTERALEGKFQYPVVYQRGYWFVVSDDYISLFAAMGGRPDYVACVVMGRIDHPLVKDVQAVARGDVRKVLGIP